MKETAKKNFWVWILALIFLGLAFYGLIWYLDYRLNLFKGEIEQKMSDQKKELTRLEQDYQTKLDNFQNLINGTKSNLDNALQTEQEKNNYLQNQFSEISNTVGALSKLSKTDPELLKKYSKVYFLNEHYVPLALSEIDPKYLSTKSVNHQILSDILPHLQAMLDASLAENLSLQVLSAYRSFAYQADLKSNYLVTYGSGANKFSADQGYSEHQLGTAIDFTTSKLAGVLNGFDKTGEYQWLLDNAYKYGFVISYPSGNTYYKFEPWHWRYVGVALATQLHEESKHFYDEDQRVIDSYLANIFD